jgi:hypothetical protein
MPRLTRMLGRCAPDRPWSLVNARGWQRVWGRGAHLTPRPGAHSWCRGEICQWPSRAAAAVAQTASGRPRRRVPTRVLGPSEASRYRASVCSVWLPPLPHQRRNGGAYARPRRRVRQEPSVRGSSRQKKTFCCPPVKQVSEAGELPRARPDSLIPHSLICQREPFGLACPLSKGQNGASLLSAPQREAPLGCLSPSPCRSHAKAKVADRRAPAAMMKIIQKS